MKSEEHLVRNLIEEANKKIAGIIEGNDLNGTYGIVYTNKVAVVIGITLRRVLRGKTKKEIYDFLKSELKSLKKVKASTKSMISEFVYEAIHYER